MLPELGLKRALLEKEDQQSVGQALQDCLSDLIDLTLLAKQVHWNVVGPNFRSFHLELDEIVEISRESSDAVAERITAIGIVADGRAHTVVRDSSLQPIVLNKYHVPAAVAAMADRLGEVSKLLRKSIEICGTRDPISEDLLIGIAASIEKKMWMLQAQDIAT